jgi:glycosyltransferase involved in cell wall biosynthesis
VRVVALEVGDTTGLPSNVDWREVGRRGVVGRYLRYRRILDEALGEDGFDAVLAHMVPRYALVAERPARRAGARLYLWYTHKGVDARLRKAVPRVLKAFTASPESLRVDGPNVVVTGHGIDLEHFDAHGERPVSPSRLLAVGRITPAKDPLTILAALSILVSRGHDVHLDLVGGGLAAGDDAYVRSVREQSELGGLAGRVELHGAVPYPDVPALYRRATVLVNESHTGSVDKVVLEAMATERPILTCNESFPRVLEALGARRDALLFEPGDAAGLADKLEALLALPAGERAALGADLRAIVARDHDVERLMDLLVAEMEG